MVEWKVYQLAAMKVSTKVALKGVMLVASMGEKMVECSVDYLVDWLGATMAVHLE